MLFMVLLSYFKKIFSRFHTLILSFFVTAATATAAAAVTNSSFHSFSLYPSIANEKSQMLLIFTLITRAFSANLKFVVLTFFCSR